MHFLFNYPENVFLMDCSRFMQCHLWHLFFKCSIALFVLENFLFGYSPQHVIHAVAVIQLKKLSLDIE